MIRLEIHGMSCEGCETTVEEALSSVSGVTAVEVDWATDSGTVEGSADTEALLKAVEEAGYEASTA